MCESIISGVISNFIFLLLTIILGTIFYLFFRRKKLLKFFNIIKTKSISLYLSNIRVVQGGSIGIDNKPRAYTGTTVAFGESLQSNLFQRLFHYFIPGMNNLSGIFNKLFVSDIDFKIYPSPISLENIDKNNTIITLGSPGYNIISLYVQNNINLKIKFDNNNACIIINGSKITDTTYAFVHKLYDSKINQYIFYTAGLSELGTIGAAYFLANNWKKLYKNYGFNKNISLLIKVNPNNYKDSSIVNELL